MKTAKLAMRMFARRRLRARADFARPSGPRPPGPPGPPRSPPPGGAPMPEVGETLARATEARPAGPPKAAPTDAAPTLARPAEPTPTEARPLPPVLAFVFTLFTIGPLKVWTARPAPSASVK
ncbi:hypothetical protein AB0C00_30865, partial [Micromonospora carbonacea]